MSRFSWTAVPITLFLGVSLLSACSANKTSSTSPASSTTTTENPSPGSTTTANRGQTGGATTTTQASSSTRGCAPTGTGVPAGASTKQIIDVDGDGRPDTGWASIGSVFGITTASGATFSSILQSASGAERSMLVADVDGHGTITALVTDQKTVALWLVRDCRLVPAQNAQGNPYRFDLGVIGTGTGVGCSQVAGTQGRSLVGLKLVRDGAGNPVSVERTQVIIDGTQARNGAHDTVPAPEGSPAAASAGQITCGNLTMRDDGVRAQ